MANIRGIVAGLRRQAEQQLAADIEAVEQRCFWLADKLPNDTRLDFKEWMHQAVADPEYEPTFSQAVAIVDFMQVGLWDELHIISNLYVLRDGK